ncbi:MAG: DUF2779 domain-containing protein [Candidatus Staskawiczbacteria bacterium]|nr:DUF2779 domain-containing protein [Candidatus Staskawiczbacteria bacterium]
MKSVILSKTNYLIYRECPKNVWYKIHRPDVYSRLELSEFEKQIIDTGNDVELIARKLFPAGILVEDRDIKGQKKTQDLISKKTKIMFHPVFKKDNFMAEVDILELNDNGSYNIYEVKSTTEVDKKTHYHDLAFQVNLLEKFGLKINRASVIHLNSDYVRQGELDINKLFKITDVTEEVENIKEDVLQEMDVAMKYISQIDEPIGYCSCIYKGRSNHCSTFAYSNSKVPEYGVHDISRIGASKAKLQELVDVGIFDLKDVPEDILNKLSDSQKNQINAYAQDKILIDKHKIAEELNRLIFPLYFLDYETFPSAIPRFDGFSPYQQIPFQYSLYILDSEGSELRHAEFLFSDSSDPSLKLAESLRENIKDKGSVIVWNKRFECKINEEIALRNPSVRLFMENINSRVYDLMDVFSKQYYVDKNFKGRVSIKKILPVLSPELSYKSLEIQEGDTASQRWNEISRGNLSKTEKNKIIENLKAYCKLDTYAMYAIWNTLGRMLQ